MKSENKTKLCFLVLLSVFFLIKGCCLIYSGDDIWWGCIPSFSVYVDQYIENGRYLTNFLSIYSCRSDIFRIVLYTASLTFFAVITAWLIGKDHKFKWLHYFFVVLMMLASDYEFYLNIFNWTSGFVNYIISLVLLFIYMYAASPVFEGRLLKSGIFGTILFLIIGFSGALCVENITLYNLLFGVFIIIFSLVKMKKVSLMNISFLIGTIIGTVLMFSVSNYTDIAANGDSLGYRSIEFELTDVFTKIFLEIIPCYTRKYYVLHAVIIISLIILCAKKFGSASEKPKYLFICLGVSAAFWAYSFISEFIQPLAITSSSYKCRAVETAFTFCYLVSLIYLIYVLMNGSSRIKAIMYLVSTVALTAPFVAISPITPRCFFADYVFWCIFAFRLASEAVKALDVKESRIFSFSAFVISCAGLGLIMFMDISNKYVDNLRIEHIREEMESGQKYIEFIKLPYSKYTFDNAELTKEKDDKSFGESQHFNNDMVFMSLDGKDYKYDELYYHFNDIDLSVLDKVRLDISMIDYNTSKENE